MCLLGTFRGEVTGQIRWAGGLDTGNGEGRLSAAPARFILALINKNMSRVSV